jgi:hypothetical protein
LTGGWLEGKLTGFGIYKFANGDVYEGNFVDGKRSGKGLMRWNNGKTKI